MFPRWTHSRDPCPGRGNPSPITFILSIEPRYVYNFKMTPTTRIKTFDDSWFVCGCHLSVCLKSIVERIFLHWLTWLAVSREIYKVKYLAVAFNFQLSVIRYSLSNLINSRWLAASFPCVFGRTWNGDKQGELRWFGLSTAYIDKCTFDICSEGKKLGQILFVGDGTTGRVD